MNDNTWYSVYNLPFGGGIAESHPSIVQAPKVPSSLQTHELHPSPAGTLSPGVVHFLSVPKLIISWIL